MRLVRLAAILITALGMNLFAKAQETTATLSGQVMDEKGQPVGGATVSVIHEPTATQTATQTNNKGIFVIPNLKPGGPYTISISFVGFETQKFDNVNLTLGNNPELKVDLKNSHKTLSEVIVQTARRSTSRVNVVVIARICSIKFRSKIEHLTCCSILFFNVHTVFEKT